MRRGRAPKNDGQAKDVPELDTPLFESVRLRFEKEFSIERDVAAEIAHALFIGNREAIYKAFGKKLMEGNVKVLEALANRAYGPKQTAIVQREPFRLEIVQVGSRRPPEAIEVHVQGELTEGELAGETS